MEQWESDALHEEEMLMSDHDEDGINVSDDDDTLPEERSAAKRPRARTSEAWNHFKFELVGSDKKKATCNYCSKVYVMALTTGTSHLNCHTEGCGKKPSVNVANMMIDAAGKLRARKIDPKVVREKFSRVIIRHDLPFAAVEYEELREYLKYMNPDYVPYSRNTVAADVVKTWKTEKDKLKAALQNIPSRICLTSDCWTAISGEGYISLTAHYVDENCVLNSKILSFCDILPPHIGDVLSTKIHECLKDWGIEKKVFTLTLDNASANDTMQDLLKEWLNLDQNLPCDGEFFHVRCCAHILNLIVQDGLKFIGGALSKIRDSVKYVKTSKSRLITFEGCVEGGGGVILSLDVPTRWNSNYLMIEKALKYQKAFNRLKVVDKSYKHCPSTDEWRKAAKILEILMPFYKITVLMSGTSYSTSNFYFGHVWKIECLLKANESNNDDDIKGMVSKMRMKFNKYWEQYSVILAMAAVLDPSMKFKLVKRCYNELDPSTCEAKLEHIKSKLKSLFEDYSARYPKASSSASISSSQQENNKEERDKSDFLDDLFELDDIPDEIEEGKSILDIYLEETKFVIKSNSKMSVLDYWKENKDRFGVLAYMAFNILSIPITTVASESSFSIGSRVLNKYRNRLLPKHVQSLLCTRSWLFGFTTDKNDEDDEHDEQRIPEDSQAE